MSKSTAFGLKDRLRNANSDKEIDALLNEGQTYLTASDETRRDWLRLAENRKVFLAQQAEAKKQEKRKTA
jgi:hypothetical protein